MSTGAAVAVTGLGLVSPLGSDVAAAFDALMHGRSAIAPWLREDMPPAVAAVAPFDPSPWFSKLQLAGVDRVSQMAVAAAAAAMQDARWPAGIDPSRIGVWMGSGIGGAGAIEDGYAAARAGRRVSPLGVVASLACGPAAHVAIRAGAEGPVITHSVACASSAVAIVEAARAVAAGEVDLAIAGGSEAILVPGMVRAWQAMQTLATPDPDDPASSCRPFDATRSGLVLGEGAAALVLESAAQAEARGARPHATVAGWGLGCDASHLTRPSREGQVRVLRAMLRHAGLAPRDIGYCNAHGTATVVGDPVECGALADVWGPDLPGLRVSSTKSMHGHLLGAAGALEALVTVCALERGEVPPTASSRVPDPACAVPVVRGTGERRRLGAAISSSFAFGGTNVVLAFRP